MFFVLANRINPGEKDRCLRKILKEAMDCHGFGGFWELESRQHTPGAYRKLKAHIVACGNYAAGVGNAEIETAAVRVDNGTVRVLICTSAHRGWSISTVDVKTAFLQAPRRATPGHITVVQPPQILKEAEAMGSREEQWLVTGALYGLIESPKDWGDFRNSKMEKMVWQSSHGKMRLEKTPEP